MNRSICIAFIRHGPTSWNAARRIQGRTDIALSPEGERTVATWKLPERVAQWDRLTSPLTRTRQTALALDPDAAWQTEPSLIETDWGEFEGERIADLRLQLGDEFTRNEEQGLDFCPPGGESPRQVQLRLLSWLTDALEHNRSIVAVTHKGVIRAALALATGWDMIGKPPIKLGWSHAHIFRLTCSRETDAGTEGEFEGTFEIDQVNIDLARQG